MKHLIIAFFLPLLVSPSAFPEEGKYDESHISKCTMVGADEELGKYVSVWVKENGQWFYVAEIRNSNNQ